MLSMAIYGNKLVLHKDDQNNANQKQCYQLMLSMPM